MADDLAAWLTQIWDEQEKIASNDLTPGPWTLEYECPEGEHDHDWDEVWIAGMGRSTIAGFNERYTCGPRDAAHVVRWQPAAVLARIAADRQILALHYNDYGNCPVCVAGEGFSDDSEGNRDFYSVMHVYPCPTVRLLALPHADRPGYREDWRP